LRHRRARALADPVLRRPRHRGAHRDTHGARPFNINRRISVNIRNLSIRARLAALLVFANMFLVASAGYAWYAISRLNSQLENVIAVSNQVEAANDLARSAHLHFKIQVQEWKDMLLRGYDSELYAKHSKGFADESARVDRDLKTLGESVGHMGVDTKL